MVPTILQNRPALADLYRAICDNPDAHDPRLMFADEAKDSDDECLRAWGDFVALQFEREKIGKPRYKVETGVIHRRGGPDYYQFDVGQGAKITVGDRVDVSTYKPGTWKKNAPSGEFKNAKHGLKVTRIESADFGGLLAVTAKEDADSVPWPKERADELDARITEKFRPHWDKWISAPTPFVDPPIYYHNAVTNSPVLIGAGRHWEATFRLGFFSDVTVANFDLWCALAQRSEFLPIHSVAMCAWPAPSLTGPPNGPRARVGYKNELYTAGISRDEYNAFVRIGGGPSYSVPLMEIVCRANWPKITRWEFRPR